LRMNSDLLELIERALAGTLDQVEAEWDRRAALGVVLASHGYPDAPRAGDSITGVPAAADDCRVFHSGTRLDGNTLVTSGGRVLCVTALGDSVRIARSRDDFLDLVDDAAGRSHVDDKIVVVLKGVADQCLCRWHRQLVRSG